MVGKARGRTGWWQVSVAFVLIPISSGMWQEVLGGPRGGRNYFGEGGQTHFCVFIPETLLRNAVSGSQYHSHDWQSLKSSSRVTCKAGNGCKGGTSPVFGPQPTSAAPANGTGNGLRAMTCSGHLLPTSPGGCDPKTESD